MRDFQEGDAVCWELDGRIYTGVVKFRHGWTVRVVPDGFKALKGNETFTRRGTRRYVLYGFQTGELRHLTPPSDQRPDPEQP